MELSCKILFEALFCMLYHGNGFVYHRTRHSSDVRHATMLVNFHALPLISDISASFP